MLALFSSLIETSREAFWDLVYIRVEVDGILSLDNSLLVDYSGASCLVSSDHINITLIPYLGLQTLSRI